jgi:ribonuclease R
MEFTPEGIRTSAELFNSAIKSRKRLNYDEVDEFLADSTPFRKKWGLPVVELLARMRKLAATLRRRRMERGALELSMPEVKIDLDKQGQVTGAHVVENTESHRIIEEFMLAANEAVAETLRDKGLFFLRRLHMPPKPQKLRALSEFLEELRLSLDDPESRFELQRLLDDVKGRPEQHAVHYAVLRSLQKAVYGPQDAGHYALASDCYCHFTSPIRRYPDLTVHRLVTAILEGRKPRQDFGEATVVGQHCSEREQRAEQAERELNRLKLLHYLSDRIGEEMDAVITGVESFGLFAQGIQLPAEGLIHVDSLVDDYYRFDRAAHTLAGHREGNTFRLGDLVRVAVARVDLERRELDFRLIQREKRPPRAKADAGERPKSKPAPREPRKTKAVRKKTVRRKGSAKRKR